MDTKESRHEEIYQEEMLLRHLIVSSKLSSVICYKIWFISSSLLVDVGFCCTVVFVLIPASQRHRSCYLPWSMPVSSPLSRLGGRK